MKAKKILSRIAAAALMVCLAVPASAAETRTTQVTALCNLPEIKVSVPSTGKVYINPQKLPVRMSGAVDTETENTPQILFTPSCILNESEVPLKVNVSVTGAVSSGSNITLSSTSTATSTSKAKRVFMFFQMQSIDESSFNDLENLNWDTNYNAAQHVIVTSSTRTKDEIVTLDAKGGENCYGAFTLCGDCTEEPSAPWKESDKLTVNVAFTFTPVPLE